MAIYRVTIAGAEVGEGPLTGTVERISDEKSESDGVEVDGTESSSGSSHVLALVSGQAVNIIVLNYDDPDGVAYTPVRIENKTFTTSQNLDPFQQVDRNFNDPA